MRRRTRAGFLAVVFALSLAAEATGEVGRGYALTPVSGGDGVFETVQENGAAAWRGVKGAEGAYPLYMYFRVPEAASGLTGPLYVEVRYKDLGAGRLALEYNGRRPGDDYRPAGRGYGRTLAGSGAERTAVFELGEPGFRRAQNLGADLRLSGTGGKSPLFVVSARLSAEPTALFLERSGRPWLKPYEGPRRADVDATTLRRKVLCGYQGWFRCPGDGAERGWVHWSRDASRIAPETLTFDMWPDMTEFAPAERHLAPPFRHRDGRPATLFSSADPRTVDRHFDWMRDYGIDGVFVQRFLVDVADPGEASRVLGYARSAANRTGRVFAVDYDLSGAPADQILDRLAADWAWLVDEMKVADDPRYLRHGGKPVVAVFGFYPDRFDARLAHRIIDLFQSGPPNRRAALVGGIPWNWRGVSDPEWARAYRRFDAIKPWNVGNVSVDAGVKRATTNTWAADQAETRRAGTLFMPVIYPGFSWDNLTRRPPGSTSIPRRRGAFYREQFDAAARLGIDTAFVAMFDEVDEGTAVFKVTNDPPEPGRFATFEGLPSDAYLRLTGEGARRLRGEKAAPARPKRVE